MPTLLERSFLMGIGLLSLTRQKAQRIADELTLRGEVQKDEARDWVEQVVQKGEEEREAARKLIRSEVRSALAELDLPTKQDLREWMDQHDPAKNQRQPEREKQKPE